MTVRLILCVVMEMNKIGRVQRHAPQLFQGFHWSDCELLLRFLYAVAIPCRIILSDLMSPPKILRIKVGLELFAEFPLRGCDQTHAYRSNLGNQYSMALLQVYCPSRKHFTLEHIPRPAEEKENEWFQTLS